MQPKNRHKKFSSWFLGELLLGRCIGLRGETQFQSRRCERLIVTLPKRSAAFSRNNSVARWLALTLTLSPEEREPEISTSDGSRSGESFSARKLLLPLLGGEGERFCFTAWIRFRGVWRVRIRREGAPNGSRGGCAPTEENIWGLAERVPRNLMQHRQGIRLANQFGVEV